MTKISTEYIKHKRGSKNNIVFMTGVTSFVGSFIAYELLTRGQKMIFLCRSNKKFSAYERVVNVLKWMGFNSFEQIEVVEGNIDEPQFGLPDSQFEKLKSKIDEIIHCVADTSFKAHKRDSVEKTNVQGTLNLLSLAKDSNCYFFHYVSTAYVAGITEGECQEAFTSQTNFHNCYEQTKHKAELYVQEICDAHNIRYKIFRPSIVCGDSQTGRCLKFNALYYPIMVIYYFKKQYEEDFALKNGTKAKKMGVTKLENDKLHLPIKFKKSDNTVMNFITIDYVVNSMIAIMDDCLESGIHHLTNDKPRTLDDIADYMNEYFCIEGIGTVEVKEGMTVERNPLESLFDHYMKPYEPYMHDRRFFDRAKTQKILEKKKIEAPEISFKTFTTIVDFAIEHDWGKTIRCNFS